MTEPPRREGSQFENWPTLARNIAPLVGLVIGLAEAVSGFLGRPVSAEVLTFAGGLLLAPRVVGAQAKRNDRRDNGG